MKPLLLILPASLTCLVVALTHTLLPRRVTDQTSAANSLYYVYFDQKIPLKLRQDTIAVESKPLNQRNSSEPFYLKLRQQLQEITRSGGAVDAADIEVEPLGEDYALVSLSTTVQAHRSEVEKKIKALPSVERTQPVLARNDQPPEVLVLQNQILLSFKSNISESEIQDILKLQDLELIRKVPFSAQVYLVRSKSSQGLAILDVVNHLHQVAGVEFATPNFIMASSAQLPRQLEKSGTTSIRSDQLQKVLKDIPTKDSPTTLFPLLWHFNSSPLNQCLSQQLLNWECLVQPSPSSRKSQPPRTDIRLKEAWQQSQNLGRNVVVAVIDTLIQWNHPDLQANLYEINRPDKCPGERYGWDFTKVIGDGKSSDPCLGDPNTFIKSKELTDLREKLQDTFLLSDIDLIQKHPKLSKDIKQGFACRQQRAGCSAKEIADLIRSIYQRKVLVEFHGTAVAGVIAAKSPDNKGLIGVAPNVKILPVRVFGLGITTSSETLVRAIGYAANRGANIINMSIADLPPNEHLVKEIATVLAKNPKLIVVAAAGNAGGSEETLPYFVRYPACIPGVVSVGATNLVGNRAVYSNYGWKSWEMGSENSQIKVCGAGLKKFLPSLDDDSPLLDVVAPGGDLDLPKPIDGIHIGGILTTGGTFGSEFWRGIRQDKPWATTWDTRGRYLWTRGTSFSTPIVAGVLALMKGEDLDRRLTRKQLVTILKQTASYNSLDVSPDIKRYESLKQQGKLPALVSSPKQYFFGSGLVNAEAAVREVKRLVGS